MSQEVLLSGTARGAGHLHIGLRRGGHSGISRRYRCGGSRRIKPGLILEASIRRTSSAARLADICSGSDVTLNQQHLAPAATASGLALHSSCDPLRQPASRCPSWGIASGRALCPSCRRCNPQGQPASRRPPWSSLLLMLGGGSLVMQSLAPAHCPLQALPGRNLRTAPTADNDALHGCNLLLILITHTAREEALALVTVGVGRGEALLWSAGVRVLPLALPLLLQMTAHSLPPHASSNSCLRPRTQALHHPVDHITGCRLLTRSVHSATILHLLLLLLGLQWQLPGHSASADRLLHLLLLLAPDPARRLPCRPPCRNRTATVSCSMGMQARRRGVGRCRRC